jgi:NAD(P)-dependent dehydrogenase (short-subunit alcohol dehydrogenase family)
MKSDRLAGKIAVVVGGGQTAGLGMGNGRATALAFADAGATVVVADINEKSADETVEMITSEGGTACSICMDITQESDCERLAKTVEDEFGRIDVLHNNVGVADASTGPLDETVEHWRYMFDVNLMGIWLTCKHVVPVMRRNGAGSIINVSTFVAMMRLPKCFAYGLAKVGVNAFTQMLALETAPYGIRVNSLLLGMIDAPIAIELGVANTGWTREEVDADRRSCIPMGRQGLPSESASAALFLASDESSYITGTLLSLDGGNTLQIGRLPSSIMDYEVPIPTTQQTA